MDSQLAFGATSVTLMLVVIASFVLLKQKAKSSTSKERSEAVQSNPPSPEVARLVEKLQSTPELCDCVVTPKDLASFDDVTNRYWAKQECEAVPAGIVRPQSVEQLSSAMVILKQHYDAHAGTGQSRALFAVRGGGHSCVAGAASISKGILIDLSNLDKVSVGLDTVTFGAGARWKDVSSILDTKGLAAVGGRNSHVGVGGLILGGGLSFFSPRYGLVCSNVVSYQVVLASGEVVEASESSHADLWNALKGGGNNFGVVSQFTLRTFPQTKVWSGFLYIPPQKSDKVLAAFHESVQRADPTASQLGTDPYAAGPLACFTYLQPLRMSLISVNLVYTKEAAGHESNKWPSYWKASSFASIWPRLWSTCQPRTLTSATDELHNLNPPGRRQVLGAITVINDRATLDAAHAAYRDAFATVRQITGLSWTLVMQPLVPVWARKGQPSPLGLDQGSAEALVIISFTVNWDSAEEDEKARAVTKSTLEKIERFAERNGTAHRYRYMNYCGDWQLPFQSYGDENWKELRATSAKYDPDGLFQRGCTGGFKLDVVPGS